jgi:outer membrane lipoprotein SlyB
MNKKYILMAMVAGCALLTTSCSSMSNYNKVSADKVGYGAQAFPATVVAARSVTIETSSTAKNVGTGVGAVLGAGAGQMLGGGSGRIVSAAGFGVLGALAGRYITDAAGNTQGQSITVKIDGTNQLYSVVQPVSEQVGYIPVGAHGIYYHGTNNSRFEPDGMY